MRTSRLLSTLLVVAACGGDDGPSTQPDAAPTADASPDGSTLPVGCDFVEQNDAGNDSYVQGGGREATGLTFTARTTLCGQVDTTHADAGKVDIDAYAITLSAPATVTLTLVGAGLEALEAAEFAVWSGTAFDTPEGGGTFVASHGITAITLDAGTYELAVLAGNAAAPAAPIAYKLTIATDAPAARCPKVTAAANFTEANDGGASNGNDVIQIDFAQQMSQSLTMAANDAPEPSAIAVAPGSASRISGSLAEVGITGSYKDADTYAFTTDAATNQLEIRLNWTGATDLDYFLFEEGTLPSTGSSAIAADLEDEFQTFAVKPSTTYWLWTGLFRSSVGPQAYDFSICGVTFTP